MWKQIIPNLGGCLGLKTIRDFEWSDEVLSGKTTVDIDRQGLHNETSMAVLVGLLDRTQSKTTIGQLNLRYQTK